MIKRLLSGWAVIRFIRFLSGLLVFFFSMVRGEWAIASMGLMYSVLAVCNIGFCCGSICNIYSFAKRTNKEIDYEEVLTKK